MARKWGSVYIVNPVWVYDCQRTGHKVEEDNSKYSVMREVSTPEREHCKYIWHHCSSGRATSVQRLCVTAV